MDEPRTSRLIWYLPQVVAATLLVGVLPVVAAWEVRSAGLIHSVLVSGVFGLVLAFGASYLGGLIWSSRPGSGDLLFSELMLWGWLRRLWIERRFDSALRKLEGIDDAELDRERRGELLVELAVALEARDPYTHGHSHRVARHAATIAKRMGLSRHEVADVRAAAMVHDVGKLSTPNDVLRKQGSLNDAEFDVIKQHSVRGAEMVSKLHNDRLTAMVLHHHERLDGTGYPYGLAGKEIPLGARIIAVADTFDAVTSTRPYRRARSHRAAIAILNEQAGNALDPAAVRAFESHYSGRRPLVVWVAFTDVPGQLISWLSNGVSAAAGPVTRAVATAAVTGAATVTAVAGTDPRATARGFSRPAAGTAAAQGGGGWQEAVSTAPFSTARAGVTVAYRKAAIFVASVEAGPTSSIRGAVTGAPAPLVGVSDLLPPAGAAQPGELQAASGVSDTPSTPIDGRGTPVNGVVIPEGGALTTSIGGTHPPTEVNPNTSSATGECPTQDATDATTQASGSCPPTGKADTTVAPDQQSGSGGQTPSDTTQAPAADPTPPSTTTPPDTTPPPVTTTPADTTPPPNTTAPPVDTTTAPDTTAPVDIQTPTAAA